MKRPESLMKILIMRSLRALVGAGLLITVGCGSDTTCPDPSAAGCETPLLPEVDGWAPVGARTVGSYGYEVIPEPDAFRTMHVGTNNSDNVWIAVAPELEFDWNVEEGLYCPEGPTYDNEGNLYFSPLFPIEDVSLISLDAETGERNWIVPGDGVNGGGGATLVLNDPDNPGSQIIYHATVIEAMALRPDGSEIWRVPTGLSFPPFVPGERAAAHLFGLNYHPATDSVVGLTNGAEIFAFDRATGALVAPPFKVPGAPAVSIDPGLPPAIVAASDALTDAVFGTAPNGESFYSLIVDTIFGGGSVVANYFAIDPNSSVIYVAATADDEDDGTVDGQSELGALYSLELADDGNRLSQFEVRNRAIFDGGTGSTPTVSEDGSRLYVSDDAGNVIALDPTLSELWRLDLGAPVAASIAVSPDNRELFAVTRTDVFKLIDEGESARLDWIAQLEAFEDDPEIDVVFQALTPTITANGIAVSVGGGKSVAGRELMLRVGVGLLDRETGELRTFTEGREESIAVTTVSPDGGIYTAGSPVRRVTGKALFPDLTEDIVGGVSRYKPVRSDLLVQEASCAAGLRAQNAASIASTSPASADEDIRQIRRLIDQSRQALGRAVTEGDLDATDANSIAQSLDEAEANLTRATLLEAAADLLAVCTTFDSP